MGIFFRQGWLQYLLWSLGNLGFITMSRKDEREPTVRLVPMDEVHVMSRDVIEQAIRESLQLWRIRQESHRLVRMLQESPQLLRMWEESHELVRMLQDWALNRPVDAIMSYVGDPEDWGPGEFAKWCQDPKTWDLIEMRKTLYDYEEHLMIRGHQFYFQPPLSNQELLIVAFANYLHSANQRDSVA